MWSGSGWIAKQDHEGKVQVPADLVDRGSHGDGVDLRVGLWTWLEGGGVSGVNWRPGLSGMLGGAVPMVVGGAKT